MSFIKEFKEFIARGNVVDLAVGVIIGGAFGKIVTSLVNDVVMPPIGLVTGKLKSLTDLYINLGNKVYPSLAEAQKDGALVIAYGNFINTFIQFLVVAACVFLLVKVINRLKREHEAKPPSAPPRQEVLLEEIRDLLKAR